MRVTNEMMVQTGLQRLSGRLEQYALRQSQLATGRRMLAPSDDPSASGRALSLRASMRSREQEQRNAGDALSWLNVADGQLQAAVSRLHRVRDLAVAGASTTSTTAGKAMAAEVAAVRSELVAVANVAHRGRPLFAGFAAGPAVERVAGGWVYAGDDGQMTRRVGEQDVVTVNVTAGDVFGFEPTDPQASMFALLDRLEVALGSGDTGGAAAAISELDDALRRIGDAQARVGAATNWAESAQQRSIDVQLRLRAELAEVEDVDIAEAVLELQVQEVAYEATLQALARALPPSLLSFLG